MTTKDQLQPVFHRLLLWFGLWSCFVIPSYAQAWNENIATLISQVHLDSLLYDVNALTGEIPVTVAGQIETIDARVITHSDNDLAAEYIKQKLSRLGLETKDHLFNEPSGRNVLGIHKGVRFPDEQYIICAHYDAFSSSPGADDNASGTAAVLEAARVLSQVSTAYTILFALWDEEEIGMEGSKAYARLAVDSNEVIKGVINLDMIGWDGNDDGAFGIHHRSYVADEVVLKDTVEDIIAAYGLDLVPLVPVSPSRNSDHSSFWTYGFEAVLLIEHFGVLYNGVQTDFNPFYHSLYDMIDFFNEDYFYSISKLATATIAHLAEVQPLPSGIEEDTISPVALWFESNYPDPFNEETHIVYSLPAYMHVRLSVFDILGREVGLIVDRPQAAGHHDIIWRPEGLPGGLYIYRLSTEMATLSGSMLKIH